VLPELRPDVVIDWMGPLDSTQHEHGVGSPEALAALREIDQSLARTLATLESLGLLSRTNIIVTSDHGFAHHGASVDVVGRLVDAGLKANRTSTDVIVASQSEAVSFYADATRVEPLVRFLQREEWVDVVFTRGGTGTHGRVSGTFSFDVFGGSHAERAADIVASMAWSSDTNAQGIAGSHTVNGSMSGALRGAASGHGGLSPWVVRNTFVASGPDFQKARRLDLPVSIADITPTIVSLFGLTPTTGPGRGRVLDELLTRAGSSARVVRRTVDTQVGGFTSTIVISSVSGHEYLDSGSRKR
jgi:arylsulfatase A-like enzyme